MSLFALDFDNITFQGSQNVETHLHHYSRWGLVILLVAAMVYALITSSRLSMALSNLLTVNDQLQAARSENIELKSELEALAGERTALSEEVESQRLDLEQLQSELDAAKTQLVDADEIISELETAKKELETSLIESGNKNSSLARKMAFYECEDNLNMDYSSVMAASSRLMSYVDGLPSVDHTSTAFRNTLWSNADSKIYGVRYVATDRETYTMQFLVYFNEFGMRKGVFYVDGQCWLDSLVP